MSELDSILYRDGDTALTGRIARPAGTPRAAILIFPTIANINAPVERRAQMLAAMGFVAFVADLYGFVPDSFEAAQAPAATLRKTASGYRARLRAALGCLSSLPGTQGLPIAAIGYCLGGQAALELARDGADIAAAVSFHGILSTAQAAEPGAVKARLLVCHGDADPLVPREQVVSFWEEMDHAGANWHFHSYSGVRHGFTDPGSDARGLAAIAYNACADRQSWAAMTGLFAELFGDTAGPST